MMTHVKILCASFLLAVAGGAPALAQMQHGSMGPKSMTPAPATTMPSTGDMNTMMSCKKMSRTAMARSRRCGAMMSMHPGMMSMSATDMKSMMSCKKMSHGAMMNNRRCADMMNRHRGMMGTH